MTSEQSTHGDVVASTEAVEASMSPQRVPVNVYETTGALVIVAPLPAVTAKDVTVELRPGSVRFWAQLRSAGPRDYLVHEWHYGGYERDVELPAGFGGGVEATLTNGQLAIRILRGAPCTLTIQPSAG
ncbi:MAG TPA: Hsp20/alpha crystallin family protein [Acidimicrobiia bacterium]|nr:Hsp20/alpha crystallin family protein [Acidimicrobiia bacterium]